MLYRLILLSALLVAVAAPALAVGDDAPSWLQQAASLQTPAYDKDVSAVVLYDEANVTIGEDGKITTVRNYAIRIITREGRRQAFASVQYDTTMDKVSDMHAWLIRPGGSVKKYGKDETVDLSISNDVYNDTRTKQIVAAEDADAGMVFGYQITTEKHSYFNQSTWFFQRGDMPVISSRYTLKLPSNWQASSVTFNREKIEPTVSGSAYAWEVRNLPPLKNEPASPELTNLAPRIAISYFPTEGARSNGARTFDNWKEVSRWYTELSDGQSVPSEALTAKAKQLTANAKTELDKIRAIARYAQDIQYISIQVGIGGYRPHSAADVFAKSYGDCKDKANLMRAMLKAINIESYLVLIFAGDPTYVREEWASPNWFNHCIIAVKVSDETKAPSIAMHPTLGRLLIFDATDDMTPVGDLPTHEQGSFALVTAGDNGALLRMPTTSPEDNLMERQANVVLDSDGTIKATISERSMGQRATYERMLFHKYSRPDYTGIIEGWIGRGANGAVVSKVDPNDNSVEGRFALNVEFTARSYGQVMQDKLLIFRPAVITENQNLVLSEAKRQYPVVLNSRAINETVRVKLPTGFVVDEMPDPIKLNTSFGTFTASYEVKDGDLVFTRSLVQRASTIPVEDYAKVKSFFAGIRAAEQAPVVLAKK
ncbi:MAG: DUF3857 domain-containing protein [Acidobacteria bacterium]|nr:DUF3857 domain-containing protein [Acidobacteriota bacterium]